MATAGQPSDVAADLHHKMCKKIAQLTKVIFHLNSKNDDHEWEMRSLTDQYESEISEILKVPPPPPIRNPTTCCAIQNLGTSYGERINLATPSVHLFCVSCFWDKMGMLILKSS